MMTAAEKNHSTRPYVMASGAKLVFGPSSFGADDRTGMAASTRGLHFDRVAHMGAGGFNLGLRRPKVRGHSLRDDEVGHEVPVGGVTGGSFFAAGGEGPSQRNSRPDVATYRHAGRHRD